MSEIPPIQIDSNSYQYKMQKNLTIRGIRFKRIIFWGTPLSIALWAFGVISGKVLIAALAFIAMCLLSLGFIAFQLWQVLDGLPAEQIQLNRAHWESQRKLKRLYR